VNEITLEWLTGALRHGAVLDGNTSVVSVASEVIGEGIGFLSCVARVALEDDRDLPEALASVVVKLEPGAGGFRDIGVGLHAFEREIRFYQEVAPTAPIRLARMFYAATQPPDYAIAMGDLSLAEQGDQLVDPHRSGACDGPDDRTIARSLLGQPGSAGPAVDA
jgi:hypothetical protein